MITITLIAPYQELITLFEDTFNQHNLISQKYDYENDEYRLQSISAVIPSEVENMKLDGEVIVARGYMAQSLRSRNYYLPVVEIPVAANDLVHCLHRAKVDKKACKIAVIGAVNMLRGISGMSEILGVEAIPYIVHDQMNIKNNVRRAVEDGCDAIISGVSGCQYAEELGIPSVFFISHKETLWYSITEAKRLAYINRQERTKSQYLVNLLDNSLQGILAIDNNGIIQHINDKASKLLELSAQSILNQKMDESLFFRWPQLQALLTSTLETDTILTLGSSRKVSCIKRIIHIKDEEIGFQFTLHDITEIQELESIIRNKINERGHIAHHCFEDIIGESSVLKSVKDQARHFSPTDSSILLLGSSGTGKELFAQSIHSAGRRSSGPFIAVNCASLSDSLLESELFGYSPGSFTGALKEGKQGLFELAHKGTVFLDEISEVSVRLQTMLLRVLQEREVMRLGDGKIIPVDIRVIAASNKDLSLMVKKEQFREDLYYRLNILRLTIPDLDQRKEDIPVIVDFWINKLAAELGLPAPEIQDDVGSALMRYSWPGNIRQLRNICERIVVLFSGMKIEISDLSMVMDEDDHLISETIRSDASSLPVSNEKSRIEEVLKDFRFNKQKAAEHLGMSRTTLWRKLKDYGIET